MILKNFKWFASVSIAIILIGIIVAACFGGLNLGIDFTGGSLITVEMGGEYDVADVKAALDELNASDAPIVRSGDTQAVVRVHDLGSDDAQNEFVESFTSKLKEKYSGVSIGGIDTVGGIASGELVMNAFLSVLIACVLMMIYIWIRFELFSGIAAVIALLHDVLIMTAVVAIFRIQINSTYIAACLTIVGYSINATIVLFDRMRENLNIYGSKLTRAELTDKSVKETLGRSINTTVTTLIMIVLLYILGVDSVKEFALPIIVGLLAGTYSSILISGPIWMKLDEKFRKGKRRGKVKAIR